jgi:hypothetical protein
MPDRGQGLTLTENVGRGLILCSALPAQWAVHQTHQMEVPTQGIMPGIKSYVMKKCGYLKQRYCKELLYFNLQAFQCQFIQTELQ